jgi:DNA-directed RNA polymerase subunit RPC12/RpoP
MEVLQQYKCPCCDGSIEFSSEAQKMKCPYCETEFEMETLLAYDAELSQEHPDNMNWETAAGGEWTEGETQPLRVYICQSCAGEIIADASTGATACPYCGSPVVMMGQFAGDLKPDYVIPFKLDKVDAVEALKKHTSGKRLLPKVFADENHIQEVKGVYVPVWLFDTLATADMRWRGTRIRTWSDSDYHYTETSHYSITRGGTMKFSSVPVDGSTKMNDTLMESIEPFDFSQAVDFQTAYLSGYLADKYDVDAETSVKRVNARIRSSTEEAFAQTVRGFTTVHQEGCHVNLENSVAKYALYPVWLLTTQYKGETYLFAMNGQTGKFVGNLPMDRGAWFRWLVGVTAVVTAGLYGLATLLGLM